MDIILVGDFLEKNIQSKKYRCILNKGVIEYTLIYWRILCAYSCIFLSNAK